MTIQVHGRLPQRCISKPVNNPVTNSNVSELTSELTFTNARHHLDTAHATQ